MSMAEPNARAALLAENRIRKAMPQDSVGGRVGVVPLGDEMLIGLERVSGGAGSLFGSPSWVRALRATYDFNLMASTWAYGNDLKGAILFGEIDDIRGKRIVSLPFSDYLDPMVGSRAAWNRLVSPLLESNVPVRFRCLHNAIPAADRRFAIVEHAVWHGADLTRQEADIWASLKHSAPQNIRKAARNGLTIREGRTLDDVRTFYRMHCSVRKSKYRMFAQPYKFFEALHAEFAPDDRIVVLLAEQDGVAVAGIFFLIYGDTLYYKFNASVDLALRPNDLLVWSGMLLGQRLGLARLDFGLSDLDQPGLVRFKDKFATEKRPIAELRWSPAGYEDARGRQAGEMLQKLTHVLTGEDIPDDVTRATGDLVYRYFC